MAPVAFRKGRLRVAAALLLLLGASVAMLASGPSPSGPRPPEPSRPGPGAGEDPASTGATAADADAADANAAPAPDATDEPEADGVVIEGVVLADESGMPIPASTVSVYAGGMVEGDTMHESLSPGERPLTRGATDERGRYRLRIAWRQVVTVTATAPGRCRMGRGIELELGAGATVVLRLPRGAVLRGTVRRTDGSPAAGATVHVAGPGTDLPEDQSGDFLVFDEFWELLEVVTDADGRYEVPGLRVGERHRVAATLDGYGKSAIAADLVPEAADLPLERDLVLLPMGRVRVRPVLADGSSPEEWRLGVTLDSLGERRSLSEPEYDTGPLSPRKIEFEVEVEGHPEVAFDVDLKPGEDQIVTVPVPDGVAIEGFVVDDRGLPVEDAHVWAHGRDVEDAAGFRIRDSDVAQSDADGRFRVTGLLPGPHRLAANGERLAETEPVRVDAPSAGVRLVVNRYAQITAHLALPAGTPRTDVHLVAPNRMRSISVEGAADLEWSVPPGAAEVAVLVPGFVPFRRAVTARPGEEIDLGPVPLDPGLSLAGRVLDPGGKPVAGAWVREAPHRPGSPVAKTDADGCFVLEHLPTGELSLAAQAKGFVAARATVDVAAATAPVELRLRAGGTLALRLFEAPNVWVARGRVRATPIDAEDEPRWLDTNAARATETLLAPGRWRIEVQDGTTTAVASAEFEIRAGETTPLDLEVPRR